MLAEFYAKLMNSLSPKLAHRDIVIIDRFGNDDTSEHVLEQVVQGITMLEEGDPVNFRRLRKYVAQIVVRPMKARGYYLHEGREIHLSGSLVAAGNPSDVALTLVHEAAHAKIAAAGWESGSYQAKSREELICERRVRAFIARQAKGDVRWQEYLEIRCQRPLPSALNEDARWELSQNDRLEGLHHYRTPHWIIGLVRGDINLRRRLRTRKRRSRQG